MGKPKKEVNSKQKKFVKQKKTKALTKLNSSDDQEVDDIMAWGRKKQNYYKEDEDQYSQLSEEEQEAKKIYQNQFNNYLNDQQLYDLPADKQQQRQTNKQAKPSFEDDFIENQEEVQGLPQEYIRQELQWILQLFKDLSYYEQDNLFGIYEKLLKSYLAAIISIKELKIPYIQYHPIIPLAVQIKTKIVSLMKKLSVKQDQQDSQINITKNEKGKKIKHKNTKKVNKDSEQVEFLSDEDNFNQDQFQQQGDEFDGQDQQQNVDSQNESGWQQNQAKVQKSKNNKGQPRQYPDHCTQAMKSQKEEHKKGLQFYNMMKKRVQGDKKEKKKEKKQQREKNKKVTFKEVNENEGRFASQLILKNKGLIKRRKKIDGNSRVKLRMKYEKKKAIHRARSGHFIRQNPGRSYEGEANIRYGKIAGVRLK